MTECEVCCEKFNFSSRKDVTCPNCDYKMCRMCTSTYLLGTHQEPHCMKCKNVWGREFIDSSFTKKFVNKDLKNHRENILFEREKCLLPETQPFVERIKKSEAIMEDIEKKRQEMVNLQNSIYKLTREYNRMRHWNPHTVNEVAESSNRLVRKCPVENCKGFLNSKWECLVCESKICEECNEPLTDGHECNPDSVASFSVLKKDSKPCPSCGTVIFKISGCPQMWCTSCHVAFNWNTLAIEKGIIHNPHFFDFQRNNNLQLRNPADIPCGGRPTIQEVLNAGRGHKDWSPVVEDLFTNVLRQCRHIVGYELTYNYPVVEENIGLNRDLRIDYMMNKMGEDEFKYTIQKREKAAKKVNEINQVLVMTHTSADDILRQVCVDPDTILENSELLKKLREYMTVSMIKISNRYNCVVPFITRDWKFLLKDKGQELYKSLTK